MNHYIDILLLPDPEFPEPVLMNSLYRKLHKRLYDINSTQIGVSFPKFQLTLGNTLRLHGTMEALVKLQRINWIGSMSSYCRIREIQKIPSEVSFRTVSRKQATMSLSKLRRLIKRGSMTEQEVQEYKAKMFSKGLDNPYVELKSGSNGHKHRRYIEFGPLLSESISGPFDQFGLSKTATVPWF
jgi:CRISPR-associated endonuclease Csy4